MKCGYTSLNHNLLVSQKKSGHQGRDYKGGLLYCQRKDIVKQVHKMCIARSVSKTWAKCVKQDECINKTKETSK